MMPYEIVEAISSAHALLEYRTELAGAGEISSELFDVIDLLPIRTAHAAGAVLATTYTYRRMSASIADPRCRISWFVYAEGAAGVPAPGELYIRSACVNHADPDSDPGEYFNLARVVIPGPSFNFALGTAVNDKPAHKGELICQGRFLQAHYVNGATAQTQFQIGVYARPLL